MTTTAEGRTVYNLARAAGCADPDGLTSPGARWLEQVASYADDRDEYGDDLADAIYEMADSAVPVYNHARWQVFVDLAAYNEDVAELGADASDLTACAGMALYAIAERLLSALLAEAGEDE